MKTNPRQDHCICGTGYYKVYCRQGAPVSIICDQGKEFVNQGMLLTNLIAAILQPLNSIV